VQLDFQSFPTRRSSDLRRSSKPVAWAVSAAAGSGWFLIMENWRSCPLRIRTTQSWANPFQARKASPSLDAMFGSTPIILNTRIRSEEHTSELQSLAYLV